MGAGRVLKRNGGWVHWTEYALVQYVLILASYNFKYYIELISPRPSYLKYFLILKTDVIGVGRLNVN